MPWYTIQTERQTNFIFFHHGTYIIVAHVWMRIYLFVKKSYLRLLTIEARSKQMLNIDQMTDLTCAPFSELPPPDIRTIALHCKIGQSMNAEGNVCKQSGLRIRMELTRIRIRPSRKQQKNVHLNFFLKLDVHMQIKKNVITNQPFSKYGTWSD